MGDHLYVWLDALYLKVRQHHRIVSMALVIAIGVRQTGEREILGFELGASEEAASWMSFLRSLVARGLSGVKLVISDAHQGLKDAIATVVNGASWQRCRVHLMRDAENDILAYRAYPSDHWSRIYSTNPLERLNREVKRRTEVVGVFPHIASVTRLVGAVLMEVDDEWQVGKRYFSLTSMQRLIDPTPKQVAERVPMRLAPVH